MTRVKTKLAGTSLLDKAAYQTIRGIVTTFCRVWCRMSVKGRENIPKEGAFLLAPVHRSILDTPIASSTTWRRMRFMGADKYWNSPRFGQLLSALGAIPVTRGSADREALLRSIHVLKSGQPLVVFPEGERKEGPIVQPLFEGAAYIAIKAGVPIVPVGIGGSGRVMPKGAKFIYPRKLCVIVGPPILAPVDSTGRAPRALVRETTEKLHAELQRLFDAAQIAAGS